MISGHCGAAGPVVKFRTFCVFPSLFFITIITGSEPLELMLETGPSRKYGGAEKNKIRCWPKPSFSLSLSLSLCMDGV